MILWTIQPEAVYEDILRSGFYHCDFNKSFLSEWKRQYDWLVEQMKKRIGPPPEGVFYPVWAWHTWERKRKKPDLRRERWGNGWKGERFVCLEIDIPEKDVLLSDFDSWSIILLNGLLADTEEEDQKLETFYESLPPDEQRIMQDKNWEDAFDLRYVKTAWMQRGCSIQATFWELRKDQITEVRRFTSASPKPGYLKDDEET